VLEPFVAVKLITFPDFVAEFKTGVEDAVGQTVDKTWLVLDPEEYSLLLFPKI
jgi:hypothetical protein